jgi:hypothetical protein
MWASVVLPYLSFTYLAGWLIVDVYRYFQSVFIRGDMREEIPVKAYSDCCLTTSGQCSSHIMTRTSYFLM